jgi:hypothetical protein
MPKALQDGTHDKHPSVRFQRAAQFRRIAKTEPADACRGSRPVVRSARSLRDDGMTMWWEMRLQSRFALAALAKRGGVVFDCAARFGGGVMIDNAGVKAKLHIENLHALLARAAATTDTRLA